MITLLIILCVALGIGKFISLVAMIATGAVIALPIIMDVVLAIFIGWLLFHKRKKKDKDEK